MRVDLLMEALPIMGTGYLGIFIVTGPTGSGKTTTLYSCLRAINQPDTKILTAEEPL